MAVRNLSIVRLSEEGKEQNKFVSVSLVYKFSSPLVNLTITELKSLCIIEDDVAANPKYQTLPAGELYRHHFNVVFILTR